MVTNQLVWNEIRLGTVALFEAHVSIGDQCRMNREPQTRKYPNQSQCHSICVFCGGRPGPLGAIGKLLCTEFSIPLVEASDDQAGGYSRLRINLAIQKGNPTRSKPDAPRRSAL